jgi:hypothetical protein
MKQLFKNTPSEPVLIILLFLLLIITGNLMADPDNKPIIKSEPEARLFN